MARSRSSAQPNTANQPLLYRPPQRLIGSVNINQISSATPKNLNNLCPIDSSIQVAELEKRLWWHLASVSSSKISSSDVERFFEESIDPTRDLCRCLG